MNQIGIAFAAEMDKLGFNIQALLHGAAQFIGRGGVPLAVGAAGGGLALYDYLKARKIKGEIYVEDILGETRGSKKVDAKEYVKDLEERIPGDRPLVSVSTKEDIQKVTKDPRFKRSILTQPLKAKMKRYIRGDNAAMVAGKKKDYIISPETVNPRVLEHEVGHARENARKHPVTVSGVLAGVAGKFIKPVYKKHTMAKEEKAWKAAKPTPLRQRALATYERGFHTGRGKIMRRVAAVGLLRGLGKAMGG